MANYKGTAIGGLVTGILGAVALGNQVFGDGNGVLGIGGGGAKNQQILDLTARNAVLEANQFTMLQVQPLQIQVAQQGEQIACLNKQLELNNQIIDGKIASVACTANSGINALNVALANLQNTVNQVIQPFVPNNRVVTPPTVATTTTTTAPGA